MPKKQRLTDEERNFFSMVYQAVLSNPFSDERARLDHNIAGLLSDEPKNKGIEIAVQEVTARVEQLEQKGMKNLDAFRGKDKEIMRMSFLFDFFYRFLEQIDQLILDQMAAGDKPIKVAFARDAFSLLQKRGFGRGEIKHYIAMWYQLRRAFFFINIGLVGSSPCMTNFKERLWNNVFTYDLDLYNTHLWNRMEDFSTLILGETGTGKGTAAAAIGRSGFIPFDEDRHVFVESFTGSFVSLNLSQFSEGLIESELFGHKKGAFTGAVEDHEGVLNRCSPYGAIFLDEIGEVPVPVQIKLLKVLEERMFSPVGSHKEYRFKGRIIAATNRSFEDVSTQDILRDDFFYRLCSDIIIVPPLRQRIKEDAKELDDLLSHSLERITGSQSPAMMSMVRKTIVKQLGKHYAWPGNVRELGQCVRRILLNRSCIIGQQDNWKGQESQLAKEMEMGDLDAQSLLKKYCQMLYDRFGTYGEVARRTKLDRRTVKKYIS